MTIAVRTGLFDIAVPAGTAKASPQVTSIDLGDVQLAKIDIRVPPGHCGTTGLQILFNGTLIVPWADDSSWLVANDEPLTFPINDEVDSFLTVNTYNADIWDHTFYCRFVYTPITLLISATPIATVVPVV